jgi:hypothetical protein
MKTAKASRNRQKRIQAYDRMIANSHLAETAVEVRMKSGGYRRPGSNKRFGGSWGRMT